MEDTPIYNKMMADAAKKKKAKKAAPRIKATDVAPKPTGIKSPSKVTAKVTKPTKTNYKRGK